MIIDLTKLGEIQTAFDFEIKSDEIDLEDDSIELKKEVSFKGKLDNGNSRVGIDGTILTEAEISCSRCLEAVLREFNIKVETAFVTAENFVDQEEIELEIKDLDVSIFDGEKIDLKEVALEQILLDLPTQILCKKDCQGLCEKCGENRNLKRCRCKIEDVDPRWSALSKLKIEE